MSVDIDITQFYQTFFEEAEELLVEMEQLLLGLDIEAPDAEHLNAIFRAAHSIKGGAATFGFAALTETTHIFENLLDRTRRQELALTRTIIDTFLETKDVLQDQLNAYRNGTEPDPETLARICAVLQQLAQEAAGHDAAPAPAPAPAPVAAAAPAAAPAGGGLKIRLIKVSASDQALLREELANLGEITGQQETNGELVVWLNTQCSADDIIAVCCFVIDIDQIVIEAAADAPAAAPAHAEVAAPAPAPVAAAPAPAPAVPAAREKAKAASAPAPAHGEGSIRVPTEKVDQIINLVGELVITQSMLAQTASSLDPVLFDRLFSGMGQLERNARDLQEAVMSIRMMPMDYVFSRFPRLVRDLASKLGKQIDLVTFGKATELDKSLIERIIDPLTHLVRNSLDHGIETPDKRVAAGKDPTGQLILSAQHHGGNIVIEVSDDGGGLNRERILAKAIQNGLPVSETITDEEVWQLIFAPGFSTAEVITDVSGRGVGMDVVKRNIQEMGGHVQISSRPGLGTTIRIVLPLTLAILDGMSVKVGEETFILPLNCVMESLQPKAEDVHTAANSDRVMHVRGEYLPLLEMHRVFNVADALQEPTQGIAVILQAEGKRFALLVDQLIGQHQVVLKNLETNYRKVPCISAATILGDGSVALIVDVGALQRTGVRRQEPALQQ
ncbi:chemotaxis protein CheA [Cupriavidus taiwanensis]|uniref:Chemotaxis protein CheA n=1 Tax=Cupriavidus taiwanensis TaxID=164546 RepID=A0A7Z7NPR1_9BURK|nr:chemotaxis protein CheA [Cupriavidus taiwanensis]SOZ09519.1 chemotactic sensory histidine kinase (soluble) [Cupriavidus taiwanensis]SOZ11642.1 chemotactic sensory histidine kinase (soluble) [Cupriavidus taiwanensis]SOZ42997.1 chemotactic sensory histidine kinase (soluble) [Cupriavidus taiwanensis]SPC22244.1 chemotactic sensory histidine kinase (soluble) [Cupriavidus taiwanensis]SPD53746.1 fused chemotactic sensory histidine kinase in two-component regulatory system with CheB and CheY: senso